MKHKEHDVVALEDAEQELHSVSSQLATLKTHVQKAQQRDEGQLATYMEKLNDDIRRRTQDAIGVAHEWEAEMLREVKRFKEIELLDIRNKFVPILLYIDEKDGEIERCTVTDGMTIVRTIKSELDMTQVPSKDEAITDVQITGDVSIELGRLERAGNSIVIGSLLFYWSYLAVYYRASTKYV